jgi:hypothetical protein
MRLTDEARAHFIRLLKEQQVNGDFEAAHSRADDILCAVLDTLGYDDIVMEWSEVGKYYA